MVNPLFENTLSHWSKKDCWSLDEVLNICWGGLEHISPDEQDEVKDMERDILRAIAAKQLKPSFVAEEVFFKRDDIVKWGCENLKYFPFDIDDFPPAIAEKHPGRNREDTQLRMIGALALLLMESRGKYKKGDLPNQSQISLSVQELLEHLQSESPNIQGLGKSNIREAIKRGLELLLPAK